MRANTWRIVHVCDDNENRPTVWTIKINHKKYGRSVWICKDENVFTVDAFVNNRWITLATCDSLLDAKSWAVGNLM